MSKSRSSFIQEAINSALENSHAPVKEEVEKKNICKRCNKKIIEEKTRIRTEDDDTFEQLLIL